MAKIPSILAALGCFLVLHTAGTARTLPANEDTGSHTVPVPFLSVLTDALNVAISARYKTQITLIAYPSQGNLMWYYQNMNDVFNQGTFDYVSARVSKGDVPFTADLSPSGGFPNAYSSVISSLYYALSTKDQRQLSNMNMAAQPQARQLVTTYEATFGSITETQLTQARILYGDWVCTKLDYVVDVIAGGRWSGRQAAGLAPLSYSQMAFAPDLYALLPDMPPEGAVTVAELRIYLDTVKSITRIADSASNGAWTVQQMKTHTSYPGPGNGGIRTVNPNTGAVSFGYQVGYSIPNPLYNINADLTDPDRSITIIMHARKKERSSIDIYTAWDAAHIDTFYYMLPDSVYINMYPLSSGQADEMVEAVYYGFTLLDTNPAAWSEQTNRGWYYSYPINQALANDTQDVSGYKFASWPLPYNMGTFEEGGTFGALRQLLICNYQKLAITMGYSGAPVSRAARPPAAPPGIPVPVLQQTAFVIGGAFSFPQPGK